MSFYNFPISILHLEPTSDCNAKCPFCERTRILDRNPKQFVYDEWDPFDLYNVLNQDFFKSLKTVLINGNLGDIVMHSNPKQLIQTLLYKDLFVKINTNGGGLSINFWKWLGNQKNVVVEFGIDGLEDTHHLYRVNTSFSRVMKNAKAYIDAGGIAIWAMTIFDYNEHQIDECKKLANTKGFHTFTTRHNTRKDKVNKPSPVKFHKSNTLEKEKKNIEIVFKKTIIQRLQDEGNFINCKAINRSKIYFGANKIATPCCWVPLTPKIEEYKLHNFLELSTNLDELNVLKTPIDKIVKNFEKFSKSWDTLNPYPRCNFECGSKSLNNFSLDFTRRFYKLS